MDDSAFLVDIDEMNEMNDLFVDDQSVVAQPEPGPPPRVNKALLARLEEMHSTNSCQKLAWSRVGALAVVAPDRRSVKVHMFARNQNSDECSLYTVPSTTIVLPSSPHEIAHVTWDAAGSILVIVDCIGGMCIYTTYVCLNRFENYGHYDCPSEDVTGSVVGFDWFEQMRPAAYYHTAHRNGSAWKYIQTQTRPRGPTHPIHNKPAALIVSKAGGLRLIYGQPDYAFGYCRSTLDGIKSAEQMITHAAMGPDADQRLLLVTHDFSRTIRIYHVSVDWRVPAQFMKGPGQVSLPPGQKFDPRLISRPLASICNDIAEPFGTLTQLSHLQVLPEIVRDGTSTPLTIMAVMTVMSTSAYLLGQTSTDRHSRVVRWEVLETSEDLHPAFEQLNGNKSKNAPKTSEKGKTLKRLPDVDLPGVVVSVDFSQAFGQLIFTRSDGEIEFRSCMTLELVEPNPSSAQIHSPREAGLFFPPNGTLIHSALSANHCMAATRGEEEEHVAVKLLAHSAPTTASSAETTAQLASIILTFASSTVQNKANDDALANLQVFASAGKFSIASILREVFLSIDLNVDVLDEKKFASDTEHTSKFIFSPSLIRCLSLQQALHTHHGIPSPAAHVARIMINARLGILSMQFAQKTLFTDPSDIPASLLGTCNYLLTTIVFLASSILDLQRAAPEKVTHKWVQSRITDHAVPILPLLASAPRFLLRYCCRYLRTLIERARMSKDKRGLPFRKSWAAIADITTGSGLSLKAFESLLVELDHHARQAYVAAGVTNEKERADIELGCLISGEIPEALVPVVQRLVTTSAAKLAADRECDPMALFFADIRVLDLTDDRETREMHGHELSDGAVAQKFDIIRKTPMSLARVKTWRRCSRCCSVMENLHLRLCNQWLQGMQKSCVCGNAWILDGVDISKERLVGGNMGGAGSIFDVRA
ncbi:hypothetical protein FH972_022120 [Carpinus fangiana]|uniref:Mediator of RNA polymerase II transcription subunit 16 n=1 Tax=Carpinus fangiana TaxID=176857 RepID=A0A5N6KRB0_9ROSI|nr:hypothetical protein FH972_022120 [Carpinus fangiana]